MTTVWLGNRKAVQVTRDDSGAETRKALRGKRCTTVHPPDSHRLSEVFTAITAAGGVWAAHSDADAPAWVASTNPQLAALLADHYGCPVREPDPQEG